MHISVLYVGEDAPKDWTSVDGKAFMTVLEFEEFKIFIRTHRGEIIASPEMEGYDAVEWGQFCASARGAVGQA